MKGFKKGIALIAVLAFLITAILPVSGLAAAEAASEPGTDQEPVIIASNEGIMPVADDAENYEGIWPKQAAWDNGAYVVQTGYKLGTSGAAQMVFSQGDIGTGAPADPVPTTAGSARLEARWNAAAITSAEIFGQSTSMFTTTVQPSTTDFGGQNYQFSASIPFNPTTTKGWTAAAPYYVAVLITFLDASGQPITTGATGNQQQVQGYKVTPSGLTIADQGEATFTGSNGSYTANQSRSQALANADIEFAGPKVSGTPNNDKQPTFTWTLDGGTITAGTTAGVTAGTSPNTAAPTINAAGAQPTVKINPTTMKLATGSHTLVLTIAPQAAGEETNTNTWADVCGMGAATGEQTFTWNFDLSSEGQLNLAASAFKQDGDVWAQDLPSTTSVSSAPITISGPAISGQPAMDETTDTFVQPTYAWSVNGTEVTAEGTPACVTTYTAAGAAPKYAAAGWGSVPVPAATPTITLTPGDGASTKGGLEAGKTNVITLKITPGTGNTWGTVEGNPDATATSDPITFQWNLTLTSAGQLTLSDPNKLFTAQTTPGTEWTAAQEVPLSATSAAVTLTGPTLGGVADTFDAVQACVWKVNGEAPGTGAKGCSVIAPTTPGAGVAWSTAPALNITDPATFITNFLGENTTGGSIPVTLTITPKTTTAATPVTWAQIMGAPAGDRATSTLTFNWTINVTSAGQLTLKGDFEGSAAEGAWTSTDDTLSITKGASTPQAVLTGPTIQGTQLQGNPPVFTWTVGSGSTAQTITASGTGVTVSRPQPIGNSWNAVPELKIDGTCTALPATVNAATVVPVTLTIDTGNNPNADPNQWSYLIDSDTADLTAAQKTASQTFTWNVTVEPNPNGRLTLANTTAGNPAVTFAAGSEGNSYDASPSIGRLVNGTPALTLAGPRISGTPNGVSPVTCTWAVIPAGETDPVAVSGSGVTAPTGITETNAQYIYANGAWSNPYPQLVIGTTYTGFSAGENKVVLTVTPSAENTWSKVIEDAEPTGAQTFVWTVNVTEQGTLLLTEGKDSGTFTEDAANTDDTTTAWTGEAISQSMADALKVIGPNIAGQQTAGSSPVFTWLLNDQEIPASLLSAQFTNPANTTGTPDWTNNPPTLTFGVGSAPDISAYNAAAAAPGSTAPQFVTGDNTVQLLITPMGNSWGTLPDGQLETPSTNSQLFTWTVTLTNPGQLSLTAADGQSFTSAGQNAWTGEKVDGSKAPLKITSPTISGQLNPAAPKAPVFTWKIGDTTLAADTTPAQASGASAWDPAVSTVTIDTPEDYVAEGETSFDVVLTVEMTRLNSWYEVCGEAAATGADAVVTANGNQTFTWTVDMTSAPKPGDEFAISPAAVTLEEGETAQLTAQNVPAEATEVTWTSSDETVATVAASAAGRATGETATVTTVKEGTATITATAGSTTATATVTVTKAGTTPGEITFTVTPTTALNGDAITPDPEGVTGVTATPTGGVWTVEPEPDQGISASSGGVTINGDLLAPGTYTLTYTAPDGSTKTLQVVQPETVTYPINVETVTGGTVTTSPSGTAVAGTTVAVTAIPDTGYEAGTITVTAGTGTNIPVQNGTFTMPASDVTVSATFVANTHALTIDGSATVTAPANLNLAAVPYGTTVTLTADASAVLTADAGELSSESATTWTFTMPDSAATITVDTLASNQIALLAPAAPLVADNANPANDTGFQLITRRNGFPGPTSPYSEPYYYATIYLPPVKGALDGPAPVIELIADDYPGQTAHFVDQNGNEITPTYVPDQARGCWMPDPAVCQIVGFDNTKPVSIKVINNNTNVEFKPVDANALEAEGDEGTAEYATQMRTVRITLRPVD